MHPTGMRFRGLFLFIAGKEKEKGFMRIRVSILVVVVLGVLVLTANPVSAHFGAVIPSDDIVTREDSKTVALQIKFIHPLEMGTMEMARPKQFGVVHLGNKVNLLTDLQQVKGKAPDQNQEVTFWTIDYKIQRPGDYTFFVEPAPYWEPAEDVFIVHYTKVCVNALGLEKGWDEPIGLETEIISLTRPYGLWTGNLFTGQVLHNGKSVPFAEVEVEYLNESPGNTRIVKAPSDPYVTQVVKADTNGVFSYAMPRAGWWGFSALSEAEWTLKNDGEEKGVEIGAVYWVFTRDMQ
jgi:cobalt/nickel transport protein